MKRGKKSKGGGGRVIKTGGGLTLVKQTFSKIYFQNIDIIYCAGKYFSIFFIVNLYKTCGRAINRDFESKLIIEGSIK